MPEQAACFFQLTPGVESSEFSASATFELSSYDATTANDALLEVTPQPGVSSGLGLSVPADAGGSIPTPLPSKAWLVVRYQGQDHYIAEAPLEGGLPAIQMALEGMAFTFGVPSRVGDNGKPWTLWEMDLQGLAPPGTADLDFLAVYEFGVGASAVLVEIPLITGGRSWGSRRPLVSNPLLMSGKGRLSRYAPEKVSYLAKANHGLKHAQLARAIVNLSDLPSGLNNIDASIGESLTKRLEVDCSSPVDEANKIMESYGYRVLETRSGEVVARHMAPVHLEPVATLRADKAEVQTEAATDWEGIPACLAIEGDRPVIPDLSDAWSVTERVESFRVELITLPFAGWRQLHTGGSAGTFVASSGTAVEQELMTERVTVRKSRYLGCLQVKERLVEQYYNPEAWRFKTNSTPSLDGLAYTYQEAYSFESAMPAKDDSSPVYVWNQARFVPVLYEREEFFRDDEVVEDQFGDPILDEDGLTQPIGKTGRLAKTTKGVAKWRTREMALRNGATVGSPPDWSTINIIGQLTLLGGGTPVEDDELFFMGPIVPVDNVLTASGGALGASFLALEQLQNLGVYTGVWDEYIEEKIALVDAETPTSEDRPGGWETGRTIDRYGFERSEGPFGTVYQFLNGETSGGDRLAARRIMRNAKTFVANGDGTHTEISSSVNGEGKPGPVDTKVMPSHLPIADVCNEEAALEANSVTVRGISCLPTGMVDPPWTDTLVYDYGVETAAQGDRLAEILLRRMTAVDVELAMPFNGLLSVLDPIRLEAVELGIDPDTQMPADWKCNGWVEEVDHVDERDASGTLRRVTQLLVKVAII